MIVILMGVSGSGKTTVGLALAAATGWPFHDADDLHPPANVDRIREGISLTDADRAPWLALLRALIVDISGRGSNAVIGCSALRDAYRHTIAGNTPDVQWVFLQVSPEVLYQRLAARRGHFAGPAILADQLRTLEEPSNALVVAADRPVETLVLEICGAFRIC